MHRGIERSGRQPLTAMPMNESHAGHPRQRYAATDDAECLSRAARHGFRLSVLLWSGILLLLSAAYLLRLP